MARVTGQDIPSALADLYSLALQPQTDQIAGQAPKYVKARDPFRLPKMQGVSGPHISKTQTAQRQKVRDLVDVWHAYAPEERARWAAEKYREGSVIFYWNFFILEGLQGGGTPEFPQMIKQIMHVAGTCPKTGGLTINITEVVPAKTVVMIQGGAIIEFSASLGYVTPPYLAWLHTTQVKIDWAFEPDYVGKISADIVEYI